MFWKKKSLVSEEYSDLSAKIIKLSSDLSILKADMERVDGRLATFNHRLNRKVRDANIEEEEEPQQEINLQDLQRKLLGMQ